MNFIKRLTGLSCFLILASWMSVICRADSAPPIRIMPLGDSLTQGHSNLPNVQGGYRNELYSLLTAAGYQVDFIGNRTDSNNPALPDVNHQGVPGACINDLRSAIGVWLKELADPDVILLEIGTNDITAGGGLADTQDRLRGLIADLAITRPYAKIIVASLLRRTDNAGSEALQIQFNQTIPSIVAEQVALGRQVSFVDMHEVLQAGDLFDGVHPYPAGYAKMGACWSSAVTSVITPLGVSGPPMITRVDSRVSLNQITVTFNKPVDDSAATVENFSLNGGVTVLQAELDSVSKRVVTLTTSPQTPGVLYVLAVEGVVDRTPEHTSILAGTTREFTSRTLIDGSFEADGLGWAFTGNNFVVGSQLPATDGSKLVVFNGANSFPNGVASQEIATIPGKKYKLGFDIGVYGSATSQSLDVTVTGNFPLLSETEELAGPGGGASLWASKTLEFVANSPTTTVSFQDSSTTTSNVDLLLDDVRLNQEITPLLTVTSSPYTGVNITVSPNDSGGNADRRFRAVPDPGRDPVHRDHQGLQPRQRSDRALRLGRDARQADGDRRRHEQRPDHGRGRAHAAREDRRRGRVLRGHGRRHEVRARRCGRRLDHHGDQPDRRRRDRDHRRAVDCTGGRALFDSEHRRRPG